MIVTMPRRLYPHLTKQITPYGKTLWYFRVNKGPRTPLPGAYGSAEFMKAYNDALAKHIATPPADTIHTVGWLIGQYLASPAWGALARETRKQFRYQLVRMKANGGAVPLVKVTKLLIAEGRDTRAAKPSDANKFVKAARKLFAFAEERGLVPANPTAGVALLALPNKAEGFHAWTEEDVAAYESRWPVGTRERLALDLLLYTGVRRGDVVKLGRQHVKNGAITIKTEKSVNMGSPVTVEVTILPPLTRSMLATRNGNLTFLATAKGIPFTKESFGTWFGNACKAAGVTGRAHGLRKIAAIRCAENGATEAQLNAMFGWSDRSRESATYIRKANRGRLAREASAKLIPIVGDDLPQRGRKIHET